MDALAVSAASRRPAAWLARAARSALSPRARATTRRSCCATRASTSCRRGAAARCIATLLLMLLDVAQLRAVAGLRRDVPAGRARGGGAAAHVSQSRRHRGHAAGRGRDFAGGVIAFTLALARGIGGALGIRARRARARRRRVDIAAGARVAVTLDVAAPQRGRLALGRVTLSSDFPLGLWRGWAYVHFPLAGIVFPAPRSRAPPLPRGAWRRRSPSRGRERRRRSRGPARIPARRPAAARRLESRRARRRLVHARNSKAPAAAVRWRSTGTRCRPTLDVEARLSRLTAWVLAAERAARPFALRIARTCTLPRGKGATIAATALTRAGALPAGAMTARDLAQRRAPQPRRRADAAADPLARRAAASPRNCRRRRTCRCGSRCAA